MLCYGKKSQFAYNLTRPPVIRGTIVYLGASRFRFTLCTYVIHKYSLFYFLGVW